MIKNKHPNDTKKIITGDHLFIGQTLKSNSLTDLSIPEFPHKECATSLQTQHVHIDGQ